MRSRAVADWFLWRQVEDGAQPTISNMKLQKLVYLAESCYGAVHHAPLVDEPIQAWDHGPAVKPLYGLFKAHGRAPIPAPANEPNLPDDVTEVLESVWEGFGSMSPVQLRTLTHDIGPYDRHYIDGVRDLTIPKEEIHAAWAEFNEVGAANRFKVSPRLAARVAALRSVADQLHSDQNLRELRDPDQLLADLRAYAR